SITENVKISLKKGNKVSLFGFGTFLLSRRQARIGRNPQTGEIIQIQASKTAKFKAGKGLKDALILYGIAFFIWVS
ncbi:MAG: hypothetical protein GTN59_00890, partial [Candidatus Dadabacteria bacterium]|nr:hypothetical protein [Candidatus Dadabacteria bacterium]